MEVRFNQLKGFVAHPTFKLVNAVLFVSGFLAGGLLALNLHELIHIKCAYAGECFGDSEWIVSASQLHFSVIFGLITSMVMILLGLITIVFRAKFASTLDMLRPGNCTKKVAQTGLLYLLCAVPVLFISVVVTLAII